MEALIVFLLLLSWPQASAEYRVYRLNITNSLTGATRSVTSNFDPLQYRDLHPVLNEEEISLEKSWMCYGDTAKKPFCPEPQPSREQQTLPKSDLN